MLSIITHDFLNLYATAISTGLRVEDGTAPHGFQAEQRLPTDDSVLQGWETFEDPPPGTDGY